MINILFIYKIDIERMGVLGIAVSGLIIGLIVLILFIVIAIWFFVDRGYIAIDMNQFTQPTSAGVTD